MACFGGDRGALATVEDLAERLRWHRGSPATYDAGQLKIAVLFDDEHGPTVEVGDRRANLVHGADVQPMTALQAGPERFAALEWDGHVLRASRDPMGEAPLFFRVARGAAWFATETHPLLAVASTEPDLEAVAAEAAFVPYTMRTSWNGILRVPPGSTLMIDPSLRISVSPYWRPLTQLATRRCTYLEAVPEFRRRFEAAVARRVGPATGVLLSGGLDSAAVAVASRGGRHPPRLLSVAFPEFPDTDETAYARAAADAAGAPLTVLEGRTDPWDPEPEPAIYGMTSILLPNSIFEVALERFAAEGVRSVLDGHDGDGALGLYSDIYGLLAAHFDMRRLVFLARHSSWRLTGSRVVRETIPPWMRPPRGDSTPPADANLVSQMRPFFEGAIAKRMANEERWRPLRRNWRRYQLLPLTPPTTLVIEQMEIEGARLGVDLLHPFTDRDLLRFLVSLPFSVKVDPTRSKPLLRDGLADLLPDTLRFRQGKVWFNSVLERRVDPEHCLRWIRESGVTLPDLNYGPLMRAVERDPARLPVVAWLRLARAHRFVAAA